MGASHLTSPLNTCSPDMDRSRSVPVHLSLDEIERLVGIVERAWQGARQDQITSPRGSDRPEKLASVARFLIWGRRRRNGLLSDVDFGEPAWDMLLDLYLAAAEHRRVSVSSLCMAAGVPSTTALRWINHLVEAGHFVRQQDRRDARRFYVDLSPRMRQAVEAYLIEVRQRILDAVI